MKMPHELMKINTARAHCEVLQSLHIKIATQPNILPIQSVVLYQRICSVFAFLTRQREPMSIEVR